MIRRSTMADQQGFYHYLPVNDQAMRWGIYLTGAGRGTIAPGERYPPAAHPKMYAFDWRRGRTLPEFQLILLTEGSGEFESESLGLEAFDDTVLIVLNPGVWHRYHPDPETGWCERWISFQGELAYRLSGFELLRPGGLFVHLGECDDLIAQFDRLLNRIHSDPVHNSILMSFHALSLIGDAIELVARPIPQKALPASDRPATNEPIVDEALEIIWTRSHAVISVIDVAEQLKVSRRTLDRRFAAATGRSVMQEINSCRLMRARRLLAETELPIKTISYLAGFATREQMRTAFHASEGKSPIEFRDEKRHRSRNSP